MCHVRSFVKALLLAPGYTATSLFPLRLSLCLTQTNTLSFSLFSSQLHGRWVLVVAQAGRR